MRWEDKTKYAKEDGSELEGMKKYGLLNRVP